MLIDDNYREDAFNLTEKMDEETIDSLAVKVLADFNESKVAKQQTGAFKYSAEETMIMSLENIKGVYGPGMRFSGTSRAFAKLTRPRVAHAHARIMDAMCPVGEDMVSFESTPLPNIPHLRMQLEQQGLDPYDIEKTIKKFSDEAAKNMNIRLKDDMEETGWRSVLSDVVENMVSCGLGILFGPFIAPSSATKTQAVRCLVNDQDVRPEWMSIHPLEFYPEAGATKIDDLSHAVYRQVVSRSLLRDWSNNDEEFNTKAIKEVLRSHPTGDWVPEAWEQRLLGAARSVGNFGNKHVLYRWWGFLSGEDIKEAGYAKISEEELDKQFVCEVWVTGERVIAVRPSELFRDRLPFYGCCYHDVPFNIYGCGLPECIFDSQDAYNACERAKYDNLAQSSVVKAQVIVGRLMNKEDIKNVLNPHYVTPLHEDMTGSRDPRAIIYDRVPNISKEIEAIQDKILLLIQDQCGIPNALVGQGNEGVHTRTSSGAALQFNNALTPLKGIIMRAEEKMVIPALLKQKDFYDLFIEDESIKGDIKVVARGVSGLLTKEVMIQRLDNLLARIAQVPEWAERVDINRIGEIEARHMGLSHERITYTAEELEQIRKQKQEAQEQQMAAQAEMETGVHKVKSETAPLDILITIMKESPEGSVVSYLAMKEALEMKGVGSPELVEALKMSAEASSITMGADVARGVHNE